MKTMYIEFLGDCPLYFGLGIKIITAMLLGGLIGLDREQKMKSAGIKTNILICIGSTVYTSISSLMSNNFILNGDIADPNRIAAQIVSGIGFLGAGAIIQGRGNVIGLTTAATIWAVAAIGVTVGFGYPFMASIITITILVTLRLIDPLYKIFDSDKYKVDHHFEILSTGDIKESIEEIISSKLDQIQKYTEEIIDPVNNKRILHLHLSINPRKIAPLKREIRKLIRVELVKIHQKVEI